MVVHGDVAALEPAVGAAHDAATVVHEHEPARLARQERGGEPLTAFGVGSLPCRATASTRSAWRIAFSDQALGS